MLSHPKPSHVSKAIKLSNKSSANISNPTIGFYLSLFDKCLQIYSFVFVSYIPSQPNKIKSSSFSI